MRPITLTLFVLFNANLYSQKEFSSLLKEIREKVLFLDKNVEFHNVVDGIFPLRGFSLKA